MTPTMWLTLFVTGIPCGLSLGWAICQIAAAADQKEKP